MTHGTDRLAFLDNLRTFIIFGVVLYHVGWMYEKSGMLSAVWIVNDPAKSDLPGIINLILDMFLMPVMFLVSGYFTPLSLKTKSSWSFIQSRLKRLMLPWLLAVLFLIPLYKIIFLYSRNLPPQNLLSYLYFGGDIAINQGWLWFLPVLFLFDIIYMLVGKMLPDSWKMGMKSAIATVFVTGFLYSFFMSYFQLYGWTKTLLFDFQNERILIYLLYFLLGVLAYKNKVFSYPPAGRLLYYILCGTIWIPMNMYVIFLLNLFFNPGKFIISHVADLIIVWFSFHLSLVGLIYILLNSFRYYLNRANKTAHRLSSYAYGVYIIHFIIMGVMALPVLHLQIPALAKYAIVLIATYFASNLIVGVYKEAIIKKFKS